MNIDTFSLSARHWQSEHIRAYCLLLARSSCYPALLASLDADPGLHTIREDSPAGVLLWAAYCEYAGLPCVAERAMRMAREKWPGDERLCYTTQKQESNMQENEQLIQHIEQVLQEARALAEKLARGKGGRENALVITQLQQAGHWALETRWQLTEAPSV